jgi:hypothetical protein
MTHSRLWAAAGILAACIILVFFLSAPHAREVPAADDSAGVASTTEPVVALHDSYAKGTHTYSGTVLASDACSSVDALATLSGTASSTQSVALALSLTSATGVCLRLPTQIPFSAEIAAPENASTTVSVNGVLASTTQS